MDRSDRSDPPVRPVGRARPATASHTGQTARDDRSDRLVWSAANFGRQGAYFRTRKGLRQGNPLSPLLFNIVVDMLALLIAQSKQEGQVEGAIPHLVDDGLSILQDADDTVIFMSHDMEKARNMKYILCVFEQLSGLKINFHKSEFFCFGQAKDSG